MQGFYLESREMSLSSKPSLIYRFGFSQENAKSLRPLLDGMVDAKIYLDLGKSIRLAPKFLLVALDSNLFRDEGWEALVAKVCPGYELVEVGLNHIAIQLTPTENQRKGR